MTAAGARAGEAPRLPVAVVTGSRAEFGLLSRTIDLLAASPALEPRVIVAGMHWRADLGDTWREIEARHPIAGKVEMSPPEDTPRGMSLAVADGIRGFSRVLAELAPRIVLLLGDRTEAFAAALAAAYAGIPVAHVHGGDASGNVLDDLHRDVISRSARLHLSATRRSADRLRAMAVAGAIEVVGAPGLDEILAIPACSRAEVGSALGLPNAGRILVVAHHPVPALAGEGGQAAGAEASEVLAAAGEWAARARGTVAVIYPNNDAGHRAVIAEIERRRADPSFRIFPSLPRDRFIQLVRAAEALLGNSSCGMIESVSLGVPAVNVGARQAGRERNANVLDAPGDRRAILEALERARTDPAVQTAVASRKNLYGDGRAAERIVQALAGFLKVAPEPRAR